MYYDRKTHELLTEKEYQDICSMAKRYNWDEVGALRVYRGIHDKTLWDRVKITPIQ